MPCLSLIYAALVVSAATSATACEHLMRISSDDPTAHELTGTYSIVNRVHNGRPVYSVPGFGRFLNHVVVHGVGRWLISDAVGSTNAWGFVDSWALSPELIGDGATWKAANEYLDTTNAEDAPEGDVPAVGEYRVLRYRAGDAWSQAERVEIKAVEGSGASATVTVYFVERGETRSGVRPAELSKARNVRHHGGDGAAPWHDVARIEIVCTSRVNGPAENGASGMVRVLGANRFVDGVYVATGKTGNGGRRVFISGTPTTTTPRADDNKHGEEAGMYLYAIEVVSDQNPGLRWNRWMIGEELGSNRGFAFVDGEWRDFTEKWTAVEREQRNFVVLSHRTGTWEPEPNARFLSAAAEMLRPNDLLRLKTAPGLHSLGFGGGPHDFTSGAFVSLRNKVRLPLLGVGVGNMPHDKLPSMLAHAVGNLGYKIVDTAAASHNEHLIEQVLGQQAAENTFVITKVWYTHLGFERTWWSLENSLKELGRSYVDLLYIHWPTCYTDGSIPWMRCAEEEAELPDAVKEAGPLGTWQESWRALERAYAEGKALAIGVSNFDLETLQELVAMAEVKPHAVQLNAWTVVHEPALVAYCEEQGIHVQVYGTLQGVLPDLAPPHASHLKRHEHAYQQISKVARSLGKTEAAVILRWWLQRGTSVVARSVNPGHLADNADAVFGGWELSREQMDRVTFGVSGCMHAQRDEGTDGDDEVFFDDPLTHEL